MQNAAEGRRCIVNRLLRRVRDFAEVDYEGRITKEIARDALDRMEVDSYGLDERDAKLLRTIIEKFDGGPVGLGTISAAIHEEKALIRGDNRALLTADRFSQSHSPRPDGYSFGI